MKPPVLEARGVTSGYGAVTAVRDVELSLAPGSVAALLGANGAGKTTLLRTLAGSVRPSAGSVAIDGADVTTRAPHERARLGLCLIPEGRGVFGRLTVAENLLLQQPSWDRDGDRAERAFDAFPALRDRRGTLAGRLSGGQQQMLALARCFVTRPRVALLDEVSMGLSPRVVDEIFAALKRLASEGVALLLVEQYVTRALALADTVHLVSRGRLTFSGPSAQVDEQQLVAGYLGAT